jgi:hypothetical protein
VHRDELSTVVKLPRISLLYLRHPGVTRAISESYEEAAAVCLGAQHEPPTDFNVWTGDGSALRRLEWSRPTEGQSKAWANEIDTVEAAAYGVALTAIESELGLVAVERARTMSGADYYLMPAREPLHKLIRVQRIRYRWP